MSSDLPPTAPPAEPRRLTLAVVLAIVAGCLSIYGSFAGIAGLIAAAQGPPTGLFALEKAGPAAEPVRRMFALQAKVLEASLPVPVGIVAVCALPLAVMVIVSAIALRRRRGWAPGWLLRSAAVLAVAELAVMILGAIVQFRLQTVMREMAGLFQDFTRGAPTASGLGATVGQAAGAIIEGSLVAGLVFGIGWSLAKIAVLLYACLYARRPEVGAWAAH